MSALRPDMGRGVDHGADGPRALAQRDAVREDGVGADRRIARDPAVVADEGGAFDLLGVMDVGALSDPDVAAQPDPGDVQRHLLVEGVEVRLPVLVQVADVLPVAVEHVAVDGAAHLEQQRKQLLREVVWTLGRNVLQHLGLEHVDTRVDCVREDLAPRRLLEEALHLPVVVRDDDAELERILHRLEPDRDGGALLLVLGDERAEVAVAECIAGDDHEGLVELRAGESDRPRRAERHLLDRVLDVEAERLAVAEVAADRLRHEGDRHDDVLEAVAAEQLDDVLHAGFADDRHHRLGLVRGERPEPRPLPTRHHDGFHAVTVRRAFTTYCAAATTASASPTQKSHSGHSVDWPTTSRIPTER